MNEDKWTSIYFRLISKRQKFKIEEYDFNSQVHHIVPRFAGGTDDECNLVRLTFKEHRLAHLLLTKIYQGSEFEKYSLDAANLMNFNLKHKASLLGICGSKSFIYDVVMKRWMKFNGRFIEYNGKLMNISQISKITRIKYRTILTRLKSGMDIYQATSQNVKPKSIEISYNGQTHNLKEWAKIFNMSYSTFKYRYNCGESIESIEKNIKRKQKRNQGKIQ